MKRAPRNLPFAFYLLCLVAFLRALPCSGQGVDTRRFTIPQTAVSSGQPSPPPARAVDFNIRAVDDRTQAEVNADYDVEVVLARRKFRGSSKPGQPFSFVLTRTDTLVVRTSAKGYLKTEEVLLVSCDTCGTYEHLAVMEHQDSVFTNLQLNQAIRLDNVYFDQSSYALRSESEDQLTKLLKTLTGNPGLQIEIAGHTDNVGDHRLNRALSENRAKVITNYLVSRGITQNRLKARGYGDTRPVAPNDTEDNKKKNRRVEFVVLQL